MTDVMFTLTELSDGITVLDGRINELDSIALELFNDG